MLPDIGFLHRPTHHSTLSRQVVKGAITILEEGKSRHRRAIEEEAGMDPLLVATDGGRASEAALEFASTYGAAHGVPVEVVSVVAPLSDLPVPLPHLTELETAHARDVEARVRRQLRDRLGPVDWPVHVRLGRHAPAICTTARERDARMIVLGVESAGGPDGNATAVELLHLAEKPVLVAQSGALPRSAVVGIDFRPSSFGAAEQAAALLGPEASLHLVHVKPALDFPAASVWGWGPCYECAIEGALDRLAARLTEKTDVVVDRSCRTGDAAEELIAATEERGADLLAIGSDGYICNSRVVVGRVARRLLALSTVPVLATPVATLMEGPFTDLTAAGEHAMARIP